MSTLDQLDTQKVTPDEQDYLLASFVRVTNRISVMSLPITLAVKGVILTGWIVSGNEYMLAMGEIMANMKMPDGNGGLKFAHDEEGKAAMRKAYEDIANEKYPLKGYDEDWTGEDTEIDQSPVAYIHLKNVQIISGDINYMNYGDFPYWRFRLSEISGWTFGQAQRD